jgi:hypothetical protein
MQKEQLEVLLTANIQVTVEVKMKMVLLCLILPKFESDYSSSYLSLL